MIQIILVNEESRASQYGIGTYIKQLCLILSQKQGIHLSVICCRSTKNDFYIERKGIRSQMSIDNVEKFVARYGKKAQETSTDVPEHLYPHMWRHSRAMHLYRNGMPLPLVAEWLGHAKMDTTRRFMQMLIQRWKKRGYRKGNIRL